jgi:trehalose-phosphatase
VRVFVISGRKRADLVARVAAPGVPCLGAFGWDSGAERLPAATLRRLRQARLEVAARLNGTLGVRVEDKGMSFALDYRGADCETGRRARQELDEVLARFRLQAVPGDSVMEVLPREIRGKGHAARRWWWRLHAPDALPIYLGNDATDEPAFESLAGGITARVGRRGSTRAHYFLRGPAEVGRFLERLEKEIR